MKNIFSAFFSIVMFITMTACGDLPNEEIPIWHGQAPKIIYTFLERYDFSDKTIAPFCTSHSSGIGSSADNLHPLCDDSVKWLEGKRFGSGTSKNEILEWLGDIGLNVSVK